MTSKPTFVLFLFATLFSFAAIGTAQNENDLLREFQYRAAKLESSDWIHWGNQQKKFSNWTSHSNRLIPVYSFGINLDSVKGENSIYRDEKRLEKLYGQPTRATANPTARYFDQTDIYTLQKEAWKSGKKNVILFVFDGMDWQTSQAASIYRNKEVLYDAGPGKGLSFLDYRPVGVNGVKDFGFCVTSPHNGSTKHNVNSQTLTETNTQKGGGYAVELGGATPWSRVFSATYLIGKDRKMPHPFTDSAASATSLTAGIKTYNASINVAPDGSQAETIAHQMQKEGFAVGAVTSVPISHATPACVYAHNVSRSDYQDITRDMLGLQSISHRKKPLPGLDVLIGCGWGDSTNDDRTNQGNNYIPGNKYLSEEDIQRIDHNQGGRYVVAQRAAGQSGTAILKSAAETAARNQQRLFGFFGQNVGEKKGHLPFQTADGNYDPTCGAKSAEVYSDADIVENPTLADMTRAAIQVLSRNEKGFYLCVESGDVDWANHNNNVDDAIGAVFSGDEAFDTIVDWIEQNSDWNESCLIVTADHGHMMVLSDPAVLTGEKEPDSLYEFRRKLEVKTEKDEKVRKRRVANQLKKAIAKAKKETLKMAP